MTRRRRKLAEREDHPRERLFRHGVHALSSAEPVEILLRNGCPGSTARELARELLTEYGSLIGLSGLDRGFLRRRGIGKAKAATIIAAFEIARRVARERMPRRDLLDRPDAVASYLGLRYGLGDQETMGALYLDVRRSVAELGGSLAHPADGGGRGDAGREAARPHHPRERRAVGVVGAARGMVMAKILTLPVHRWRQGMETIRVATLPTAASIRRKADDGEATGAEAAVMYLESVVTVAFEARADDINAELAGRCRLAEDVLHILTGSSDIDDLRAWMGTRGLERLKRRDG